MRRILKPIKLRSFLAISIFAPVLCLAAASSHRVEAGSRGVGVGIGVGAGLQILNQLSKGQFSKGSSSATKGSTKKRTATGTSKKTAKKAKQQRDNDGEVKSTAKAADEREKNETEAAADPPIESPPAANLSAPAAAVAAPAVTGAISSTASPAPNLISTTEEVTSAQEHLKYLGYDISATTGVLDLSTKIAIMKFQDSIGTQATGALTIDQLQRLYVLADERQKRSK